MSFRVVSFHNYGFGPTSPQVPRTYSDQPRVNASTLRARPSAPCPRRRPVGGRGWRWAAGSAVLPVGQLLRVILYVLSRIQFRFRFLPLGARIMRRFLRLVAKPPHLITHLAQPRTLISRSGAALLQDARVGSSCATCRHGTGLRCNLRSFLRRRSRQNFGPSLQVASIAAGVPSVSQHILTDQTHNELWSAARPAFPHASARRRFRHLPGRGHQLLAAVFLHLTRA